MSDNTYRLPVIATISEAWKKVYGVKAIFAGAMGICVLISMFFQLGLHGVSYLSSEILSFISIFISKVILYIVQIGLLYMGLQRALDKPIQVSEVFFGFNHLMTVLKVFIGSILMMLTYVPFLVLLFAAMVLAKHPGEFITLNTLNNTVILICVILGAAGLVYFGCRLRLVLYIILNENLNPIAAYKKSFAATRHNVLRILAFWVLSLMILLISAIPFGIGLIWSLPYMFITWGVLYKNMTTKIPA